MKFLSLFLLPSLVLLFSCESIKEDSISAPEYLEMKPEQLESMDIALVPVKLQAIQPIVFATGKVTLSPNNQAIISSNIGGKIAQIHVVEGDYVREGQKLITITSMQLIELQQNYLAARNDMELYKSEFDRQSILRKNDIASESEFLQTQNKYLNAKNSEESIREKLKLLGLDMSQLARRESANVINQFDIKSPINGSVFKVYATPGMTVETNTSLLEAINMTKMYADIDVYEQDLDQVQIGQQVEISFINKNITKIKGTVKHIINSIDPESRAIKVHVDFVAPKGAIVLPEMAVKVKITGKTAKEKKPTIPLSALLQEGELEYIYYALPKDKGYEFHKAKVVLGENDGVNTEFSTSEPLPDKAMVVSSNVYLVDAENKKRVN